MAELRIVLGAEARDGEAPGRMWVVLDVKIDGSDRASHFVSCEGDIDDADFVAALARHGAEQLLAGVVPLLTSGAVGDFEVNPMDVEAVRRSRRATVGLRPGDDVIAPTSTMA